MKKSQQILRFLVFSVIILIENQVLTTQINSQLHQNQNIKEKDVADDGTISFTQQDSIKQLLLGHKGDFSQDLFDNLLTRKDIGHLFYSEIQMMMTKLEQEFPGIIKISSIGKTWQERPIQIITLDARQLMKEKGVTPLDLKNPIIVQNISNKAAENDPLVEAELLEKNEDINDQEKKKLKEQTEKFNQVPQDIKDEAIANQLGIELTQLNSHIIKNKKSNKKSHKQKSHHNLLQLKSDDNIFNPQKQDQEEYESISELTKTAKETIKNQFAQEIKQAEPNQQNIDANKTLTQANSSAESKVQIKEKVDDKVKVEQEKNIEQAVKEIQNTISSEGKNPQANDEQFSILITGATHARELLSSQVPLFMCLKLLHQGVVQNNTKYQKILATTKFHFIPIINVDGANLVEEHWNSDKVILNKRKNMNPKFLIQCGEENGGVDLNRNYGVDWAPERQKNLTELCGDFWPGDQPFSEPETVAIRDFVSQNKKELKFIINCHTSGNDFIWPYNGREPNDIETRSPGYLAIFQDIAEHAHFPEGSMKGNSYEVIGDKMGGDADDYMLATFGIPSITAEMGYFGQFIKDWRCQSKSVCFEIIRENSRWIEYIFTNIGRIAAHVIPK